MFVGQFRHVLFNFFTSDWSDWSFLASLGMLMGGFSFGVDYCVRNLRIFHFFLMDLLEPNGLLVQYICWLGFAMLQILFPAGLCYYVAPQAAGSGIPEMKTLLRGVIIEEYLTVRTLAVKCIGLIMVLSSSLPFGKEGPFVHISSALATLQFKIIDFFLHISEPGNPSKEMLTAACAVGVSSTYGAPIGGVLFSIEVTSVFFQLRNYWRCFLASVCSAIVFRLLAVAFTDASKYYGIVTVEAFSPTSFKAEFPFDILYLMPLCLLGSICGICAVAFIRLFRRWTLLIKNTAWIQRITQKSPFIYPTFVVVIIASINFPVLAGRHFAGGLTPREAVEYLFQNYSWQNVPGNHSLKKGFDRFWSLDEHNHFLPLSLFTLNMFWMTALSITMAIPSGAFIPIFVTGAGLGRLFGETVTILFPNGPPTVNQVPHISPGGYAVVGAAAFAGAVTNAISTSVVVTEMIGQTTYLLPTIIALLIANFVRSKMEDSLYDTIICIKKLPYLPPLPSASSSVHQVFVCDIMVKDLHYLTLKTTFAEMFDMLSRCPTLKAFPLVDDSEIMTLLGCIRRSELLRLVNSPYPRSHTTSSAGLSDDTEDDELKSDHHKTKWHISHNPLIRAKVRAPELQRIAMKTEKNGQTQRKAHLMRSLLNVPEITCNQEEYLEGREWVKEHMNEALTYDALAIDPTPFQLVEKTSLYKVHALFSLLGLNRAYVTKLGRLVGVVSLKELRQALEIIAKKTSN